MKSGGKWQALGKGPAGGRLSCLRVTARHGHSIGVLKLAPAPAASTSVTWSHLQEIATLRMCRGGATLRVCGRTIPVMHCQPKDGMGEGRNKD